MAIEPVVTQAHELITLPTRSAMEAQIRAVREFQRAVQELFTPGHDFGVIPGTGAKPTLLKPGAEKLVKLLSLADEYEYVDKAEEWEQGFFNYTVRCTLRSIHTGALVASGIGNCNSWESKYRWRWAWPSDVPEAQRAGLKTRTVNAQGHRTTQYRIENDDVASSVNTIIKMAVKRALVAAALSAGRLSDVFTQDLEDKRENERWASEGGDPEEALGGNSASGGTPKPPISSEHDPLWRRWVDLSIEAAELGIVVPDLALPVAQDALIAAGQTLAKAIIARRAEIPEAIPQAVED